MPPVSLLLILLATALPDAPWAVTGDGKSCAPVGAEILAELSGWREDPANTVAEEGIFGLVHPDRPSALVLLFATRAVCERISWAAGEERAAQKPASPLTAAEVNAWLDERLGKDEKLAAAWRGLAAEAQRGVRQETLALFAGQANRRKADRAFYLAERTAKPRSGQRVDSKAQPAAAARLLIWPELYAKVFGAPYVAELGPVYEQ